VTPCHASLHVHTVHILSFFPPPYCCFFFFFFNDTATTEIYTLSLHDALPILTAVTEARIPPSKMQLVPEQGAINLVTSFLGIVRSEEHTSELQSLTNLVCRLLLEKKKQD